MPFINNPSGDLEKIYVDDYELIDQYAKTGSLWLWGYNINGQLGTNDRTNRSSPVQTISGGTNWKQVSVGNVHTAAIKTDGTLWVWGNNFYGELGTNDRTLRSSPVQTVAGGTNWKQVSAGSEYNAAIKTDGTLWVWGENDFGQLGTNNLTKYSSPVQTVAGGTNWKQVSAGNFSFLVCHTAAIKTDGTLWVWGSNGNGQLGDGSIVSKSSPVQTVAGGSNWKQVSVGSDYTAAIKTDGTLWVWGSNFIGRLGTGNSTQHSSPVQTIAGGTNWKQVSAGGNHTSAIKTDGTLWVWGQNSNGQLGTNNTTNYSSPVQTVSGGTNWKQVSAGGNHTSAIKTDGTLWVWGINDNGQLGTNNLTKYSSPVQTVAGGTNWKQVGAGNAHTAAVYFYDANNLYPSS